LFADAWNLLLRNALLRQQLIAAERKLAAASGGRHGSASRLFSPRELRQLGVKQPCSSSPRPFFAGIAQDSARSGGVALGGPDGRRQKRAALIREMAERNPRWGAERYPWRATQAGHPRL
jgi:hypothetical protein